MKVSNPEDDFKPVKLLIELETIDEVEGFYNIFTSHAIMEASGLNGFNIRSTIEKQNCDFYSSDKCHNFVNKLKELLEGTIIIKKG